jgi:DNA processing protein
MQVNYAEKIYTMALSIASSPVENRIWDVLDREPPRGLYERIALENRARTQDFIALKYPSDPFEAAKAILEECAKKSINVLDYWSDGYPALLRQIARPPIILYSSGMTDLSAAVSIVGTRNADPRSSEIAFRIASELARAGFGTVSGMAVGIDREAHMGSLKSGGPTVGVLANGIDIVYPAANRDIFDEIKSAKGSSLISEYPPGIIAGRWTFVRRNRIISGMTRATVVVKAGDKSGALITAGYALEQNRDVFACPGHAFEDGYSGCHGLIRNGAIPVHGTDDILREMGIPVPEKNPGGAKAEGPDAERATAAAASETGGKTAEEFEGSAFGKEIFGMLTADGMEIDELVRRIGSGAGAVLEEVNMMELSGAIVREGNRILPVRK